MYGRETQGTTAHGYVDFGGQWVGPTQYHMQDLVAELGIEHFDSYEEGRSILSWNGTKSGFDGDISHLLKGCTPPTSPSQFAGFPVVEACRQSDTKLPDCVHDENIGAVWNELLEISKKVNPASPWLTPGAGTTAIPGYDQQTFGSWVNGRTSDASMKRWLSYLQSHVGGAGGFEPDKVSLLHMAWTQKVAPQSQTPEKWLLLGGAGQIPKRLADELIEDADKRDPQVRIALGAPVSKIEYGQGGGVTVKVGTVLTVNADAVIIAIPPRLRGKIIFSPALPTAYTDFIKGSPMGSMSKVHAVYETAFWRQDCLSGSAAGDLRNIDGQFPRVCEFIADSSPPGGKPGILTSFIAANRNCDVDGTEAKRLVLGDFKYYFGEQAEEKHLKDWVYYNWNGQDWSCGAFTTHQGPNVWTTSGKDGWRTPVNKKIFWAGTETSDEWPGYFDGAVKAGITTANDVLKILL